LEREGGGADRQGGAEKRRGIEEENDPGLFAGLTYWYEKMGNKGGPHPGI